MEFKNFIYLTLLLVAFFIPIALELRKPSGFFSNLKYLFPAIVFSGAIYVIWDLRFEEKSIWVFNQAFLSGISILNLPLEEWIYFLVMPFLGVFIYEFVKYRFPKFEYPNTFLAVSLILLLIFGAVAYSSRQILYPFFTFFLLFIYLGYTVFRNRFKKHYTKFYLAYVILLLPFMVINGVITALPVIEYNPVHNFGIRLYTIPIENFVSLFLLFIINVTIFEYLKERRIY
jgi:lycopene cyclase domain-containing protein